MKSFTPQQQEALDNYDALLNRYPELAVGRKRRPIVRDRPILEAYAIEHDCILGVAVATSYVYFVIDLVASTAANGDKQLHPYIRVVHRGQLEGGINTVILATIASPSLGRVGDIILVEQERHATGKIEIAVPRGFGKPGLTGEENALKELEEETGYIGKQAVRLGATSTDSGLTDGLVSFYHVPVIARQPSAPEIEEAIIGTHLMSLESAWDDILAGRIDDSFTVQAIAFFQKRSTDPRMEAD